MVGSPENVITQFLGISHGVPGTPGSGDNDDGFYSTGLRVATADELQVWLEKSDGIPVLQLPGTDYTLDLTNPACAVIGFDTTGGLPQPPYPVLPDPGDIITCVRLTALTQTLNLRYNERLPSGLMEASLDKILRLIADTRAVKALRFPVTDPIDQACELPGPHERAGRVLGFDDDGNLTVYPVVEIGEGESDAYRGDRGKEAYDHSQLPHAPADATKGADWNTNVANKPNLLALGQTETTAHRGDHGHAAYQHAISEHAPANAVPLGETDHTAYRGDLGKAAYDHSQTPHFQLGVVAGTAYPGDKGASAKLSAETALTAVATALENAATAQVAADAAQGTADTALSDAATAQAAAEASVQPGDLGDAAARATSTGGQGFADSGKVAIFGGTGVINFTAIDTKDLYSAEHVGYFSNCQAYQTGTGPGFVIYWPASLTGNYEAYWPSKNGTVVLTANTSGILQTSEITGISAFAVDLLDETSAANMRTKLGLGNSATRAVGTTAGTVADGGDARLGLLGIWQYSSPGSYSLIVPPFAKAVSMIVVGGGGGGGSGRRGISTDAKSGGGGGAGGSIVRLDCVPLAFVGMTAGQASSLSVGGAGQGGAAVTADDTSGATGYTGSASTCGSVTAVGGAGGGGGTLTAGAAGAGAAGSCFYNWTLSSNIGGGTASTTNGGAGNAGSNSTPASGGGGGGITANNAARGTGGAGGAIGRSTTVMSSLYVAGANGGNGGSGTAGGYSSILGVGAGGGGGSASATTFAGNPGGAGGNCGGGGGGGSAITNGQKSGAGGNGGSGFVKVIFWGDITDPNNP